MLSLFIFIFQSNPSIECLEDIDGILLQFLTCHIQFHAKISIIQTTSNKNKVDEMINL
jgi:hypothetical protein